MPAKPRATPPADPRAAARRRRQGLADAAAAGQVLSTVELSQLTGRSAAAIEQQRNGGRLTVAQSYRAWRVEGGWQLSTVDGMRVPGAPLAPPAPLPVVITPVGNLHQLQA